VSAHEELLNQAEAYALGALDEGERPAFEAHLGTCADCRKAVAEAALVLSGLSLTAEPVALPEGAGKRLMQRFRAEIVQAAPPGPAPGGAGSIVMALVAAGALAFGGWAWTESQKEKLRADAADAARDTLKADVQHCQEEKKKAASEADELTSLFNAPDKKVFPSDNKHWRKDYTGAAEVVFSPSLGKVAVIGAGLEKLPAGKAYKLWEVASGTPVPMRVLGAGPIQLDTVPAGGKAFAISIEDAAGAATIKAPTDPVLLFLG
jgi:anti-sigma-K factor RskA